MGFGTRKPTSNDPNEGKRDPLFEALSRPPKERLPPTYERKIKAALDAEVAKGSFQTTMHRQIAEKFLRAGYVAGLNDENDRHEALELNKPSQFDEMS